MNSKIMMKSTNKGDTCTIVRTGKLRWLLGISERGLPLASIHLAG
jgi:hypothetical protein